MTLDAPRLLENIAQRNQGRIGTGGLVAYWYRITGSRREYADQIRSAAVSHVIPLVVEEGFVNANELMSDLNGLICDNEVAFADAANAEPSYPLVLVLLRTCPRTIPCF